MLRAMKNKMDLFSHPIELRKREIKKKKHEITNSSRDRAIKEIFPWNQ